MQIYQFYLKLCFFQQIRLNCSSKKMFSLLWVWTKIRLILNNLEWERGNGTGKSVWRRLFPVQKALCRTHTNNITVAGHKIAAVCCNKFRFDC